MQEVKKKHVWAILVFAIFYGLAFAWLEINPADIHISYCGLDDFIPFCEYFVIPYLSWFLFAAVTLGYFVFFCKEIKEYYQLLGVAGTGMMIFLIISFVWPNGHELRPLLTGDNPCTRMVAFLYQVDPAMNVFPSMHVFIAMTCCGALCRNEKVRRHKLLTAGIWLLTGLIILSTVCLKQHSILDVLGAMLLYVGCYYLFYQLAPRHEEELKRCLTKKQVLTIPNALSLFRLVLAILFLGIYQRYGGMEENRVLLTWIVIISGITDFLDGKIARKFNMVSELGKFLDPIADKVTQGVLLLCLLPDYPLTKPILLLFILKEAYMGIIGTNLVIKTKENEGAQWYGKVSTAVFYVVMIALIFIPNLQEGTANLMILCCGCFLLLSLIMYARYYRMMADKSEAKREIEV
jgi:CDP-diacylglycerol--glycerol-3-phosphate 3-phosphatidyltransferase